jgi:hypothetical protein
MHQATMQAGLVSAKEVKRSVHSLPIHGQPQTSISTITKSRVTMQAQFIASWTSCCAFLTAADTLSKVRASIASGAQLANGRLELAMG